MSMNAYPMNIFSLINKREKREGGEYILNMHFKGNIVIVWKRGKQYGLNKDTN